MCDVQICQCQQCAFRQRIDAEGRAMMVENKARNGSNRRSGLTPLPDDAAREAMDSGFVDVMGIRRRFAL